MRPAEPADVPLVLSLIRELAEYERAATRVTGTEELLFEALFGAHPVAESVVADMTEEHASPEPAPSFEPVGFALFFTTFSTWLCRPGIYLEDLYVRPAHRRSGIGRLLLTHVARVAVERGCGRLDWSALSWNTPALEFYRALGAERMDDWSGLRLEGESLERVAGERIAHP
ncbi:MAG: GNAT family N-acetyltransferase [Solirubrobacterales bacterium]|nr:GNAT family N-acetyltransferase [Solirubrobacterales bacterium]